VTAVINQLICCDLVNLFHLCVQVSGSVSDEVGGSRNAFVQVAEDSISRRDALISHPDMLIYGVEARAKRLECLETVAQGIKAGSNAIKEGINVSMLVIKAGIYPAYRSQDPVRISQCGGGALQNQNPCGGCSSRRCVPEVCRG